jgi:hypothetical protein
VKAAQAGTISPWPDGARLAKVAWPQQLGADGLIHPGPFLQVELMIKDSRGYKSTDGWGWGRWRGLELKPYGSNEHFVDECEGCHLPVRADDAVYTQPITQAHVNGNEVVNNRAALPASLPYQPLTWNPITMYVDLKNHTTATLFGDPGATSAVRAHKGAGNAPAYPAGSVLALVTWAQRDDPHWFGARIPDRPVSVEFVQAGQANRYQRFDGDELKEDRWPQASADQRTAFILSLPSADLP